MAMKLRRAVAAGTLLAMGAVGALAAPAAAHPLGDFTTNVYSGLRVEPDRIVVDHVVDLAEVPTFRAMPDIDADGDGTVAPDEADRHAAAVCARQADALTLTVAGEVQPLAVTSATLQLLDGQAGLQTSRVECDLRSAVLDGLGDVDFADTSYAGRLGWREVVVTGDETTIAASDVPASTISARLAAYPEDRLQSPLSHTTASFTATPGGDALTESAAAALPDVPGLDWATETFTGLVDDRALTVPFAAIAIVVAMVLGSFHAIAPGHGKTVMAAYIVGQHGTVRQALGLGATVAVTHTAGVLALGMALSTTASFAPEELYPWLGLASGLLVAAIGAMLLVRAVRNRDTPFLGHQHGHGPGQHTHHWDIPVAPHPHADADAEALQPSDVLVAAGAHHAGGIGFPDVDVLEAPVAHPHDHGHGHGHGHHDHDHRDHDHGRSPRMGRGGVMLMGLAGGLVPSPSALVVLLGAIALGRAWFGVVVIAAYGVGMAATLVAAGLLMAKLRDRVTTFVSGAHPTLGRSMRYLPMGTAGLVLVGGFVLAGRVLGTL
jgi:nickel/cobalt transporter (NicO) family protein